MLTNYAIKSTVWNREDSVSSITDNMKNSCYIDSFDALYLRNQKTYDNGAVEPTIYELKYTVIDYGGNKYQVSRKLYAGDMSNITVGGSVLTK